MIIEEKVGKLVFQEQRQYRIYESEEDRDKGNWALSTSSEEFYKEQLKRAKERAGEQTDK